AAPLWIPRHSRFEPGSRLGKPAEARRLFVVDEEDERLPRALDAADVHVVLDEAVDRVDRRRRVFDPRDVVRDPILLVAGFVKPNQRSERLLHRWWRVRQRVTKMADDPRDGGAISSADSIYLLDQAPSGFDETGIETVSLVEALEVGHRDAGIEVVGAR